LGKIKRRASGQVEAGKRLRIEHLEILALDDGAGYRKEIVIQASSEPGTDTSRIVLKPKLRAPVPRPEQLVRGGLLELLHNALDCKVSVISAPTGYGKTTLLAHWRQVEEAEVPFAWVSLDEQDNDPARLWGHIVEALLRVLPEERDFGADVLVGLGTVGESFAGTTLSMLINELAESPRRVVVVLDDYQFVTEKETHESVAFFVEHLPENVHLVISSRSDPPLPLGRLRVMGELAEIRAEEIAFSEEEAERLLNEKMGLDIEPDDVAVLLEHTEGWPAGIYLAALSLQSTADKHAFIETFRGSNRYIVGLLGDEVLAQLPEDVRKFLLETSVLRAMTGPLCDAVTGGEGSARILRELVSSNLFVVCLDEQGEWYRYHHLFSELLLYELKSDQPDLVPTLRGRASAWLEDAGYVEGAIRQAIAATDYEHVGALIARHWFGQVLGGRIATVERWLESLPEGKIADDAALCLVEAWICALYGDREGSVRFLLLAEGNSYEGPLPDGTASVESGVALVRGVFGYGGVRAMAEAIQSAAELESERISPRTVLADLGLGLSLYYRGDTSRARKPLEEGLRLTRVDQPVLRIVTLSALSLVAGDEGHLEEAESLAREARGAVERFKLQEDPQSTVVNVSLGRALAKRSKLAEAQAELENGLSMRQQLPDLNPWPTIIGLLTLSDVELARGDRSGARNVLAEARSILEGYPDAGIFLELLERQERKVRTRKPQDGQLDEKLTERELTVLRLLGGELTARQMAESLYVAPNTVRTQIKSIYRKLGVSSRGAAVQEAHARGLN
jgi:LuxR family transcriptional regulator, maltose regulon positive regulatory protein